MEKKGDLRKKQRPEDRVSGSASNAGSERPRIIKVGALKRPAGVRNIDRRAFLRGSLGLGTGVAGLSSMIGCAGGLGGDDSNYYQVRLTTLDFSNDPYFDIVRSVVFYPDGSKIAASSYNGIKVWDLDTEAELWSSGWGSEIAINPRGDKIAVARGRILNADTGALEIEAEESNFDSVAFSPDGERVVSVKGKDVYIWDATSGRVRRRWEGCSGADFNNAVFSPGGEFVAACCYENVIIWDTVGNEVLTYTGHDKWLTEALCFSPDGTRVASGGIDAETHVWDATTGELISKFEGHKNSKQSGGVEACAFSPDGLIVASAGSDSNVVDMGNSRVHLFNPDNGELIVSYKGHAQSVQAVAFSPDGTMLASGGHDGTVHVWRADTTELTVTCACDSQDICSCDTVAGGGGGSSHYWFPN